MSSKPPELQEKDFIQNGRSKSNLPFWIWGVLFTFFLALIWGVGSWYNQKISQEVRDSPFLQVTNREISVFLWQFPEHMRVNKKAGKTGYLPAFQYLEKVNVEPEMADLYVIAPPELLFLYHTWDRLLKGEFIPMPVSLSEFKEFLDYSEEWQPNYWPKASSAYVKFANSLLENKIVKEGNVPEGVVPKEVLLAFQGWKNFFKAGEAINQIKPTYAQMQEFLELFPNYSRNFWRNIVEEQYPNYLKTSAKNDFKPSAVIPPSELAPFLKFAFYNYLQSLSQPLP